MMLYVIGLGPAFHWRTSITPGVDLALLWLWSEAFDRSKAWNWMLWVESDFADGTRWARSEEAFHICQDLRKEWDRTLLMRLN